MLILTLNHWLVSFFFFSKVAEDSTRQACVRLCIKYAGSLY